MTPPLTHKELVTLIGIMNKMLIEANNSNWQAVNCLDQERRKILEYKKTPAQPSKTSDKQYCYTSDHEKARKDYFEENTFLDNSGNQDKLSYQELKVKVVDLDKTLISTVKEARQALLMKKRQNANQFKAKQGYATASALSE